MKYFCILSPHVRRCGQSETFVDHLTTSNFAVLVLY